MTLGEYAQKVGVTLADAYNNNDMVALKATFLEADELLDRSSNITESDRKWFWDRVREVYSRHRWAQKQANTALIALMQAIERNLSQRGSTAGK